jgi:hypothetical protein
VAPTATSAATPTKFEVHFVATAPLSDGSTITIGDSTGADSVTAGASQVQVLDGAATCLEPFAVPVLHGAKGSRPRGHPGKYVQHRCRRNGGGRLHRLCGRVSQPVHF